jgi:hypothetical protein
LAGYFYLDKMTAPYKEVGPGEDEFAQLSIPKEHKQLILALVRSHSRGKLATPGRAVDIRPEMDLVRGKGKGLIILLHGVPGVGKTSTAESIASFTKRPLYSITCGDLGETAREVEESLEAHFTLAHRWGCILLLDEVDVFLAKRERGDIKRNALVSGGCHFCYMYYRVSPPASTGAKYNPFLQSFSVFSNTTRGFFS